jgi:hypothetical protein
VAAQADRAENRAVEAVFHPLPPTMSSLRKRTGVILGYEARIVPLDESDILEERRDLIIHDAWL